jgi:hypothetical protein
VKYFFLADGWTFDRVWEFGGLWDENSRRRKPEIKPLNLGIVDKDEKLWLYQVEDDILMIEVKPTSEIVSSVQNIGQVVLKRLIGPDEAIKLLSQAETIINRQI